MRAFWGIGAITLYQCFSSIALGQNETSYPQVIHDSLSPSSYTLSGEPSIEVASSDKGTLKVQTLSWPDYPWNLQMRALIGPEIKKGDCLLVTLKMRLLQVQDETGEGRVGLVMEQSAAPYEKLADTEVGVGKEWKVYQVPVQASRNYDTGEISLNLRLGYRPQEIEISEIKVETYGQSTPLENLPATRFSYEGRKADSPWRKEAMARIEKYRKADLQLKVVDSEGKPIVGAKVLVKLQQHAFRFGTAVSSQYILGSDADSDKYKAILKDNFNKAVPGNELKWGNFEKNPQRAIDTVSWLFNNGFEIKGHNIIWPGWTYLPPGWSYIPSDVVALQHNPPAMRKAVDDRFARVISAFPGQIHDWDVINEPGVHNDVMKVLGDKEIDHWMKMAHALNPGAKLVINEATVFENNSLVNRLAKLASRLKADGVPLDGIAIQSHYGWNLTPPEKIYNEMNQLSKLGLSLQVSEFDIDINDQQLQADYLRDFMTVCFSHPAVTDFIVWGFWEGDHWRPRSAFWKKDWSLTPMGKAYQDLFEGSFNTNTALGTDRNGCCQVRGFLGQYKIQVEYNGKSVSDDLILEKNAGLKTIKLTTPD